MKKFFCLGLLLLGLTMMPVSEAATQGTNTEGGLYVTDCNEWISLFSSASVDSNAITRIPLGDVVTIIDDNDPCYKDKVFAHVRYMDKSGYALYQYLTPHWTFYRVTNCKEWISLRAEPSVDSQAIACIPLGENVRFVKNAANGFCYVYYNGQLGYALADYLE
ncbi:MAG: SH3 domain-containing protein [Anaerovibrio sp.]|uniref:SH3 domain-containing protein n=1 Tax=Anaerovibrio sp. TaxID=1872532 RepID=UPI0025D03F06|nr:SH3 domain-containing protein [Anaerovibrio sp.]MCR5175778.1 SH3 domain-containing protein [Anaerovibrio sp.]